MFYYGCPMDSHPDRAAALASLRARWGAAAPRPAVEVFGALAAAPLPAEAGVAAAFPGSPEERPLPGRPALVPLPGGAPAGSPAIAPAPGSRPLPAGLPRDSDRVISTGFPELDALLATGGLPRTGTVAIRGAGSSGATTLALRAVAEAQAGGALVAWVDLARSLDPVEAVARGVRLEWLAVLVPGSAEEALAMAGTLLQAHAIDVLVLDLAGARPGAAGGAASVEGAAPSGVRARATGGIPPAAGRGARRPRLADQLTRLVAFARRVSALLLVLEPAETPAPLRAALDGAGLRLELRRRGGSASGGRWSASGRRSAWRRTTTERRTDGRPSASSTRRAGRATAASPATTSSSRPSRASRPPLSPSWPRLPPRSRPLTSLRPRPSPRPPRRPPPSRRSPPPPRPTTRDRPMRLLHLALASSRSPARSAARSPTPARAGR